MFLFIRHGACQLQKLKERWEGIQSRCWATISSVSFPAPSLFPFTPAGSPPSGIVCQHCHSRFCTCIFALVCVCVNTSTWPAMHMHSHAFTGSFSFTDGIIIHVSFCFPFERVKTSASVVTNNRHNDCVPLSVRPCLVLVSGLNRAFGD